MGNRWTCMQKKEERGGKRTSNSRSQRKMVSEEELLHRQALAMVIQQHQLSQRFNGSMSRRIGSTSSRRRDLPDSITNGKQVTFRLQLFQPSVLVAPLYVYYDLIVMYRKNYDFFNLLWFTFPCMRLVAFILEDPAMSIFLRV